MSEICITLSDDGSVKFSDGSGKELTAYITLPPRDNVKIEDVKKLSGGTFSDSPHFIGGTIQWWGGSPICVRFGDRVY